MPVEQPQERIRDDVHEVDVAVATTCANIDSFLALIIEKGVDVAWGSLKVHINVGK